MAIIMDVRCRLYRQQESYCIRKALVLLLRLQVLFCLIVSAGLSAHDQNSGQSSVDSIADLKFYTEDYPPYNYSEGDEVKGLAVDLLMMSADKLDTRIAHDSIKLRPWPHSYHMVINENNTVLFSTARIKQRENDFLWAGPIASTQIVLLAKKNRNIEITTHDDLKKYVVGGILNDVGEQLVLATGYPEEKIIRANTGRSLGNMLTHGRIDLWAYDEHVALWLIDQSGLNPEEFEVVYTLQKIDLYFAFNHNISRDLVDSFQSAIDAVKQPENDRGPSAYEKLLKKYGAWGWDLK